MKAFLAAVLLIAPVFGIKYSDCGSKSTVSDVQVTGCENVDVCPLHKGAKAQISIKFGSKEATKTLKAVVHGIISGIPMPFPVPQPDACTDSGISCPLTSGTDYVYKNELDVKSSYPSIAVTVKWELRDDNDAAVVCVKIPAKLV